MIRKVSKLQKEGGAKGEFSIIQMSKKEKGEEVGGEELKTLSFPRP